MKKANAAMPTTPAARPSRPSMKFTAFVEATTTNTVKSTRTGVGHEAGRQHLPGELRHPVELADVVERPKQADDAAGRDDTEDLLRREEGAEVGQRPCHEGGRDETDVDPHSPEPGDGRLVDVTLTDGRERARRDGDAAHEGCGEVRDRSGHDEDEDVLVHLPTFARTPTLASGLTQRGYAGKRVTRSLTSARTCLLTAWSGSASPVVTAWWMSRAICFISSSPMPWVVTDGVPTRMPEAMLGFCGSNGMAFLLSTMPAASAR